MSTKAEREAAYQARNIEAGDCRYHKDRPAEPGTQLCRKCRRRRRKAGRQRYQAKSETKCSNCGETGHNRRTCPKLTGAKKGTITTTGE